MKSTKTKGAVDRMRCAACGRSHSQHDGKGLCPEQRVAGWDTYFTPQTRGRTR